MKTRPYCIHSCLLTQVVIPRDENLAIWFSKLIPPTPITSIWSAGLFNVLKTRHFYKCCVACSGGPEIDPHFWKIHGDLVKKILIIHPTSSTDSYKKGKFTISKSKSSRLSSILEETKLLEIESKIDVNPMGLGI